MAVLIDMDMQSRCTGCPFCDGYNECVILKWQGKDYHVDKYVFRDKNTKPDDCPLMELPSAQIDNEINLCDSCQHIYPECPSGNNDVLFGSAVGNDNICACSKYLPSAEPEPTYEQVRDYCYRRGLSIVESALLIKAEPKRKKGKWLINSDGYYPYCSNCKNEPTSRVMTDFRDHCGADMRGEQE